MNNAYRPCWVLTHLSRLTRKMGIPYPTLPCESLTSYPLGRLFGILYPNSLISYKSSIPAPAAAFPGDPHGLLLALIRPADPALKASLSLLAMASLDTSAAQDAPVIRGESFQLNDVPVGLVRFHDPRKPSHPVDFTPFEISAFKTLIHAILSRSVTRRQHIPERYLQFQRLYNYCHAQDEVPDLPEFAVASDEVIREIVLGHLQRIHLSKTIRAARSHGHRPAHSQRHPHSGHR